MTWRSRAQFLGFLASTMRRILVDHARRRRRAKRLWLLREIERE